MNEAPDGTSEPPDATTPDWTLTPQQTGLVTLLADGALAPLRGFLTPPELVSVRSTSRLPDGTPWRGEVALSLDAEVASAARAAGRVTLRHEDGTVLAALTVADAPASCDDAPAVADRSTASGDSSPQIVGGTLRPVARPPVLAFEHLHRSRDDVAHLLSAGTLITAVQPRQVPDVATLERWRQHLDERGAQLLVQPVFDDLPADAWAAQVRAYVRVMDELPRDRAVLQLLPLPRDADAVDAATLRALVASNHGATALLDALGVDTEVADARGLELLPQLVAPAGPWHPAVRAELERAAKLEQRGVAVLLTGLSGSGKSTLGRALRGRLLEDGGHTVTLLDGDLVRRTLSSGLGFSAVDRETNVRRIGWVAAEIARHGGVAICAPIAPEDRVRRAVRRDVESAGGRFVLVHVATPLEVCEQRDVKGLYAKARAGELTGLTGVDAPYEVPDDADVVVDTSEVDVGTAVDALVEAVNGPRPAPPPGA